MSNTLKSTFSKSINGTVTVYTVPAATTSMITGITVSNESSSVVTCSLTITRSGTVYYLMKDLNVPVGSNIDVTLGKIVLQTGDAVAIVAASTSVNLFLSMTEVA